MLECLTVVVGEHAEHLRFALRDLAVLEATPGQQGQRQRDDALSTASAAGPALDERSTVLPRRTATAPAGVERLELLGCDAALGADDDAGRHRRRGRATVASGWSASSWRT